MKKKEISGVTIEITRGDITNQANVDAVVNAANAELRIGGGVAGAIHRAAGPKLTEEAQELAPIKPGEAVITKAYNLPNTYVVHCLGPVYGRDKPEDELLAACYSNALALAEDYEIESIAFPAISTGAFGYPMKEAAEVAFRTIREEVKGLEQVKQIRFVLWGEDAQSIHEQAVDEVFG